MSGEGIENLETDEEKGEFIRGVLMTQVWAMTVKEDPEDIVELTRQDEEVGEEWDKMVEGEEHEFGVAVADHYGIPYTYAKNGIKLHQPWGERYRDAWVELGVEPSFAEKIANAVFFGVMSRD